MTISNKNVVRTIVLIVMGLLFLAPLHALTIVVPSYADAVKKSKTIVAGKFTGVEYEFRVNDILKNDGSPIVETIVISWPFGEMSFSLDSFVNKHVGEEIILVCSFDSETQSYIPAFGSNAFWPQGVYRDDYLPKRNIKELKIDIMDVLSIQDSSDSSKTRVNNKMGNALDGDPGDSAKTNEHSPESRKESIESELSKGLQQKLDTQESNLSVVEVSRQPDPSTNFTLIWIFAGIFSMIIVLVIIISFRKTHN